MRLKILLGVLLFATTAMAQLWTVTLADFEQVDGIMQRISPEGVQLRGGNVIAWDQIVALEQHAARPIQASEPYILFTRAGQRLLGSPLKMNAEQLTWKSSLIGEVSIPLEQVRGWGQVSSELPAGSGQEDVVLLNNGDVIRGIIEGAGGGISLLQGNATTEVKWDAIRAVSLAQIGQPPANNAALRLDITDGSVLLASAVTLEGDRLRIESAGRDYQRTIPAVQVMAIQNLAGRVRFWASLEPSGLNYTPYTRFSEDRPEGITTLDQVTVSNRIFRKVIQIRPRTVLAYSSPVDGKFHLRFAAGNPGKYTNMTLRIAVNGSLVQEISDIRTSDISAAIEAPVKAGDSVQLELDYGLNFDVQDYLWLLDAAFVAQ